MSPKVLVALDFPDVNQAVDLARSVADHVSGFKVGLELLMSPSPDVVERVAEIGKPVFADAKLHDIPATVERAARQLGKRGARWVTAHVPGGVEMLRAAASGLAEGSDGRAGILGVTVLTSVDASILRETGLPVGVSEQVRRLVGLASDGGAEGVICSLSEVGIAKNAADLIVVTPGVRLDGDATDDQRRVSTVGQAKDSEADYLVIGRSITRAPDPLAVVERIEAILRNDG